MANDIVSLKNLLKKAGIKKTNQRAKHPNKIINKTHNKVRIFDKKSFNIIYPPFLIS